MATNEVLPTEPGSKVRFTKDGDSQIAILDNKGIWYVIESGYYTTAKYIDDMPWEPLSTHHRER